VVTGHRPRLKTKTRFCSIGLIGVILGMQGCQELPRTYSTRARDATVLVRDDFEREGLGEAWRTTGSGVGIERGHLRVEGVRNHPCWLTLPLPDDVRIGFDAWSGSEEGDIKVELAGDGHSAASSANYVATGYVVIFGGWNNSRNVIARRSEHGTGQAVATEPRVQPERRYHFDLTRVGHELSWELDGQQLLVLEDPEPLRGEGHRHFAFSGWEAPVEFDNLVIEALGP